jgi:alkylhydroperoxidase/carboxymuconolactone decarboxylase family protein YurZ
MSDPLAELSAALPAFAAGYARMLAVFEASDAALPPATRELIFTLLYVAAADEANALAHARLAGRAGLSRAALAQGLAQLAVVHGMPTWTSLGWRVLATFDSSPQET